MVEVMDIIELRAILINLPIQLQKTGTTQTSPVGSWGMVPNLVTGNEDRSARFKSYLRTRATAALPFMKLCYADENLKVSKGEFERPPNLLYKNCYNAPAAKKTAYAKIPMNLNLILNMYS
jgi:hypothetical protein